MKRTCSSPRLPRSARRFAWGRGVAGLLPILLAAGCARFMSRTAVPVEPPAWPGAGGNAARSSADTSAVAFPLAPVWSRDLGRGLVAPPALADSVVVVGTVDRRLMALRWRDGKRTWVRGFRAGFRAGAAAGGRFLYGVTDSPEGVLRCLSLAKGSIFWGTVTGPAIASPYVSGETVLVAAENGRLLALRRDTGKLRWERTLPGPLLASPVVADSLLFVASLDGTLLAARLADGTVAWQAKGTGGVEASLVVAGQRLLVGSLGGGVAAWSSEKGEKLWERALPAGCVALAAGAEEVYALGPDGRLAAFSLDGGRELWSAALPGPHEGSLAAAAGLVLVGGRDGWLRAVDRTTGELGGAWDAGEPILVPPLVRAGRVLVAGARGRLTLLAAAPPTSATTPPATAAALPPEPHAAPAPDEITVYTNPFGASVLCGGALVGLTPWTFSPRSAFGDTLLFTYPGFEPFRVPVDSLASAAPPPRFVLRQARSGPEESATRAKTPSLRRAGLAFAGALLAAGGAVYCKDRADDEYGRYLRTGDLEEMRAHFRSAERWDRLCVAAWGATHVAAALAVTWLIRHDEEANRPAPPERGWEGPEE